MAEIYKLNYPLDLFLWSDGFWCFRREYSTDFLRASHYRVVRTDEPEWIDLAERPNRLRKASL